MAPTKEVYDLHSYYVQEATGTLYEVVGFKSATGTSKPQVELENVSTLRTTSHSREWCVANLTFQRAPRAECLTDDDLALAAEWGGAG